MYRILETCLHGVVWLNLVSWVELSASPGQRWEAEGEARGFPSLARGGRNSTQLTKFSDRTPSKHVSNNIHIWILHFNCRVQLSYRFTTPMARPIRGREMKESYVYIETVPEVCVCVSLPEGDTHTDQRVSFYTLNQAMLHRIIYSARSDSRINIGSLYE